MVKKVTLKHAHIATYNLQNKETIMLLERERSYIFSEKNISNILFFLGAETENDSVSIHDQYLNKNLRIITTNTTIVLTHKDGDKASGQRIEKQYPISDDIASILSVDSKLNIVKQRHRIVHNSQDFIITLDAFMSPMKVVILEIESTTDEMPPTARQIFGKDLVECPLSAWDLFRQKIGICGAPSSGKTEMAKTISGLLNTRLEANAFNVVEYATSFIQKYENHPDTMDQFMIWYSQKSREDDAASTANIVISDCPTFLSYIYMLFHKRDKINSQFRIHLSKLYKRVLEDLDSYSRIIYLRPHTSVDNNIRFQTNDQINDLANRIHCFLKWHNVPHMVADRSDVEKIVQSIFFINNI